MKQLLKSALLILLIHMIALWMSGGTRAQVIQECLIMQKQANIAHAVNYLVSLVALLSGTCAALVNLKTRF